MSCQPNVQRSWSPLGQPHCMDASSSNRRVNVLGALDWGKKKLHYHRTRAVPGVRTTRSFWTSWRAAVTQKNGHLQ